MNEGLQKARALPRLPTCTFTGVGWALVVHGEDDCPDLSRVLSLGCFLLPGLTKLRLSQVLSIEWGGDAPG